MSTPAPRPALPAPAWLLLGWALVRRLQFALAVGGFGTDVIGYFQSAQAWVAGAATGAGANSEYPPGALPLFVVPYLAGGQAHYVKAFLAEMALFDLAALFLVGWVAHQLGARVLVAGFGYLAATALLQPVLYSRFDLAPAALTLGALAFSATVPGAVLLGFAGAMKLWPLALSPLWLLHVFRRSGTRRALLLAAVLAAALLLPFALLLPRAGLSVLGFLSFHGARGLQVESVWASLGRVVGSHVKIVAEFGAMDLQCGAACEAMRRIAVPASALLALAPAALLLRRAKLSPQELLRAGAATVLGVLIGSHVLSPQFLVWAVPLLVLSGDAAIGAAIALAGLTTLVYPVHYSALLDGREQGHALALALLFLRNAGLVLAYALLLRSLRRQ